MNWQDMNHLARCLAPLEEWRHDLAQRLRKLTRSDTAAVATCPPGDWHSFSMSSFPHDYSSLWEGGARYFPRRLDQAGQGWQWTVQRFGCVFAPELILEDHSIVRDIRTSILQPTQLKGITTGYVLDPHGEIVGLITVAADRASDGLFQENAAELTRLCETMGKTVSTAIQVATELGYVPRGRLPLIFRLSPRERQIAELAAEGFTPLNIAARLGIAEGTTRIHLKNVYRKLEIHSRVQLARCVLAFPARNKKSSKCSDGGA